MFASQHQHIIPAPGVPEHTITIHKLSGYACEVAQAEHAKGVITGFNGRGWAADFMRRALKGIATEADAQKFAVDPLAGYDRLTVARFGIKAWTLTETVTEGGKTITRPKPLTSETIADIDDEALEVIATEVMRLTKPGLFKTAEELEATRKNG